MPTTVGGVEGLKSEPSSVHVPGGVNCVCPFRLTVGVDGVKFRAVPEHIGSGSPGSVTVGTSCTHIVAALDVTEPHSFAVRYSSVLPWSA